MMIVIDMFGLKKKSKSISLPQIHFTHSDCFLLFRFEEAFKIYGNGPVANRKIAEYIGTDITPKFKDVSFFFLTLDRNSSK